MALASSPNTAKAETYAHQSQRMPTGRASSPLTTDASVGSSSLTTLSSVGQRQAQAPRRSPLPLSGPHASSFLKASKAPIRGGQPWTQSDDAFLIASYKEHGRKWTAITKAFEEAGRTKRIQSSITSRLGLLQAEVAKQRKSVQRTREAETPSSMVSSRQAQQPQRQDQDEATALLAASSALHARTLRIRPTQTWSPKEIQKLSSIPFPQQWTRNVFELFCTAFPRTTRTESSVITKWNRIHRYGQNHGRGKDSDEDEGLEASDEGEEEDTLVLSSTSLPTPHQSQRQRRYPMGATAAAARTLPSRQLDEDMAELGHAAWLPSNVLRSADTAAQHSNPCLFAGGRFHGVKALQGGMLLQASSTPTKTSQQLLRARCLNFTVSRTPNGFTICNASPGHRIYISSPTSCQVTGPFPPSAQFNERVGLGEPAAPFVFEVEADEAIKALKLPPRTTMSVAVVRTKAGEMCMQTLFAAIDGYMVCFESSVA